jgi:hypothetical protein
MPSYGAELPDPNNTQIYHLMIIHFVIFRRLFISDSSHGWRDREEPLLFGGMVEDGLE